MKRMRIMKSGGRRGVKDKCICLQRLPNFLFSCLKGLQFEREDERA